MNLHVVILAAGRGQRMRSAMPKVLHQLAGKPLLQHVIDTVKALNPAVIHVVYGHQGEQVRAAFSHEAIHWVEQTQQLGTGHALLQVLPHLPSETHVPSEIRVSSETQVLVLFGDVPLISADSLQALLATPSGMSILTAELANPTGLGRVVRNEQGQIQAIVEEKDATDKQRTIQEIYAGIMQVPVKALQQWLPTLTPHNAQGEYYLTDLIAKAVEADYPLSSVKAHEPEEVQGINDRVQLAQLERYYQLRYAKQLQYQGITIIDPQRLDIRGEVSIAADVILDVNVILIGKVTIGAGSYIGPHVILKDVEIGENVRIEAQSVIEGAIIAADCTIGPFARIRPGTQLAPAVHIGNFVEVKNSQLGEGTKAGHLSYLGDAQIGDEVNIGAGTITCNYDGANKHRTEIAAGAFIGSATQLVAPVKVGERAVIGAGSTITKDAPAELLTLSRSKQQSIPGWKRPIKKSTEKTAESTTQKFIQNPIQETTQKPTQKPIQEIIQKPNQKPQE